MKIKHFAGYGTVDMQKKYIKKADYYGEPIYEVGIEVTGDHEWGIDRSRYPYDCVRWLLHRVKQFKDVAENLVEVACDYISGDKVLYRFTVYSYLWQR